jgi:hypothetical protein
MENDIFNQGALVFLAFYELFIRVYPTAKDWSILSIAMRIIGFFVPNRSKVGAFVIQDKESVEKRKRFFGWF